MTETLSYDPTPADAPEFSEDEQEKMEELASLMSFDTIEKLVEDLRKFDNKVRLIRICGQGEPLTNRKLGEYIKYLCESDVTEKIELITNGSLLKGKMQDVDECLFCEETLAANIFELHFEQFMDIYFEKMVLKSILSIS